MYIYMYICMTKIGGKVDKSTMTTDSIFRSYWKQNFKNEILNPLLLLVYPLFDLFSSSCQIYYIYNISYPVCIYVYIYI